MTTSYAALAAAASITSAGRTQLLVAAGLGILTVVLLIAAAKFHPFLALMIGTAVMGGVAGVGARRHRHQLHQRVRHDLRRGRHPGRDRRHARQAARRLRRRRPDRRHHPGQVGDRGLPWAMALIAGIIGLPMFFEIGVVLLVPIVILVARRTHNPLMRVGIPALAGLSILHGLIPPHPGPVAAITALHADLGDTLLFGLIVAVPTLVLCGPLLAHFITQWVPVMAPESGPGAAIGGDLAEAAAPGRVSGRATARRAGTGQQTQQSTQQSTAARPRSRPGSTRRGRGSSGR